MSVRILCTALNLAVGRSSPLTSRSPFSSLAEITRPLLGALQQSDLYGGAFLLLAYTPQSRVVETRHRLTAPNRPGARSRTPRRITSRCSGTATASINWLWLPSGGILWAQGRVRSALLLSAERRSVMRQQQMLQYLALLGVSVVTGLGFRCAALIFVRAMKYVRGSSPIAARIAVGVVAVCGLTIAAMAHVFTPFSIEAMRLFIKSGWAPLLWWGACLLATWIPSMNYMSRRLEKTRAPAG
jgi:hypothetical protein